MLRLPLRSVPVFAPGTTELKLDEAVLVPYVLTMSPGYLAAAGNLQRTARLRQTVLQRAFARRLLLSSDPSAPAAVAKPNRRRRI